MTKTKLDQQPGSGCSKLMTSIVNVSLTFQTLISEICQHFFCWKKCEKLLQCKSFSHFFNKNTNVFGYKVVIHLRNWPLNDLVKLWKSFVLRNMPAYCKSRSNHRRSVLCSFVHPILPSVLSAETPLTVMKIDHATNVHPSYSWINRVHICKIAIQI